MPEDNLSNPFPLDSAAEALFPVEAEGRTEAFFLAHARTGSCPPLDLIFAAEEDVLPSDPGSSIRGHVALCTLCQTILAELDPANTAFTPVANARIRDQIQSRTGASSRSSRSSAHRNLLAFAAVLLVGVVGFFSYRLLHPSPAEQPTVAANDAATPPPHVDLAELQHVSPLAPPDDVPALVTRGASATHEPLVRDLLPAFRAYNRGDFARAASAFAPLVTRFPHSDIPPLYLGVAELELNQNAAAQHALQRAFDLSTASPTVSPTASQRDASAWYLAVADLRLAEPQAAAPLLHQLCAQPHDPYAPRACSLARQINPS